MTKKKIDLNLDGIQDPDIPKTPGKMSLRDAFRLHKISEKEYAKFLADGYSKNTQIDVTI